MASGGGGGNPEGQLHLRFVPTSLVDPGPSDPDALGPLGSETYVLGPLGSGSVSLFWTDPDPSINKQKT
jgi:hypothetical protein